MYNKFKEASKNERGDVLILFALLFTVMVLFLAFAVDLGMMYTRRLKMYEMGHIMRETRFTKNQDTTGVFLNSENPGKEYADNFNEYARKNGFKGEITVEYNETHPSNFNYKKRQYTINMRLKEVYKPKILGLINIKEVPIVVEIKGSGFKEYGGTVWYPKNNPNFTRYVRTFPAQN